MSTNIDLLLLFIMFTIMIFTALQLCSGIQSREIRLSVRPSVYIKHVSCDKTKDSYAHILYQAYMKECLSYFFRHEEWLVEDDDPLYLKFRAKLIPFERQRRFSIDICSASAITSGKKSSVNTNRKSTMRFSMSLR